MQAFTPEMETLETEYGSIEQVRFFTGSGASAHFYYFMLDEQGERWIAKGELYDPRPRRVLGTLETVHSEIAKELIANALYARLGIPVARIQMAMVPVHIPEGIYWKELAQEIGITETPAILTRFLDHFQEYPYLPEFYETQANYLSLEIENQWVVEAGLGRVLAVAQWLNDIDVIGGSGKNIGYRLRQHPNSEVGALLVETCKIDPGYAFHDFEQEKTATIGDEQTLQLATMGEAHRIHTHWTQWPVQTQAEYWETINAIVALPVNEIEAIFTQTDPNGHFRETDLCLARLISRQASLCEYLDHYQANVNPKPQMTIHLPPIHPDQDQPQDRLAQHNQWMLQRPSVQQAFHFYLTPSLMSTDRDPDAPRYDCSEKIMDFLTNPQYRALLLLGKSGAGKSIETYRLIERATELGFMPLRIELKRFSSTTVPHCILNTLQDDFQLSLTQIENLKEAPLLFILDGFDEIQGRAQPNLYDTHQLGEWVNSKVITTCRSQYYTHDMKPCFIPENQPQALQLWHLAPVNEMEQTDYILAHHEQLNTQACLAYLDENPKARGFLDTPLMLKLFVDAYPILQRETENNPTLRFTRYRLYEAFLTTWTQHQAVRTIQQLGHYEDLTDRFQSFSETLAFTMYAHAKDAIEYQEDSTLIQREEDALWSRFFTDRDPDVVKLRLGCPLTRTGNTYSFLHKSFADHLVARRLWQSLEEHVTIEERLRLWNARFLVDERAILEVLAENILTLPNEHPIIERLYELVLSSRGEPAHAKASSNAISLLNVNQALCRLIGRDFSGIHAPRADLSFSNCTGTDFTGADLSGSHLEAAIFIQTNFTQARLYGVFFGEYPSILADDYVYCIAYSPDGRLLAIAMESKIQLITAESGRCEQVLEGHTSLITSVMFSPNGEQLASGSGDNTIRLWNVVSGRCEQVLEGHMSSSVTFSPNGEHLASGSQDNTIRLWDISSGRCEQVFEGHTNYVNSVTFSPAGEHLASGSDDKTIRLWDIANGRCEQVFEGHTRMVTSVTFSPNGRHLASGSKDKTIRLWDIANGRCEQMLEGHTGRANTATGMVNSITFSPNGRHLASGSEDKTIRLWDIESGRCEQVLKGHTSGVTSVTFSPNGEHLASGSMDKTIRLWDIESGRCEQALEGHTSRVTSVTFSSTGGHLASGSFDKTIRLWDIANGRCEQVLEGHMNEVIIVTFSPNGRHLASGSYDYTIRLWDIASGRCEQVLEGHTELVNSVTFSPNGECLASKSNDKTIRLWDIASGRCKQVLEGHTSLITSVMFSPNGKHLASGSLDKTIRLWDIASGRCEQVLEGHTEGLFRVTFSPTGEYLASGGWDKTIRLWDIASGCCEQVLEGHAGLITSVMFSPNGKHLISGSYDRTIRLWDIASGRCEQVLEGHTDVIKRVTLNSSGEYLASGSDNTIRLWNVLTGTCEQVIPTVGLVNRLGSVVFSGDDQYLTAGGDSDSVFVYLKGEDDVYRLVWQAPKSRALLFTDCKIDHTQGLSEPQQRLLTQRGALGEPAPAWVTAQPQYYLSFKLRLAQVDALSLKTSEQKQEIRLLKSVLVDIVRCEYALEVQSILLNFKETIVQIQHQRDYPLKALSDLVENNLQILSNMRLTNTCQAIQIQLTKYATPKSGNTRLSRAKKNLALKLANRIGNEDSSFQHVFDLLVDALQVDADICNEFNKSPSKLTRLIKKLLKVVNDQADQADETIVMDSNVQYLLYPDENKAGCRIS